MARAITSVPEGERIPPLVLQISEQLERDIIQGRYRPGDRIREQELADRLGTSRGPVREALRLVELDGMIEITPWRGARVVDMSPSELDDLLEVVAALQALVSRLVAAHSSDEEIAAVERLVDEMEASIEEGAPMRRQLRIAFEAGALLREICGSERAGEMLMKVGRLAYWQHRYLLTADVKWRRMSLVKWRRLIAALKLRDRTKADGAAHALVDHSKAYILRAVGSVAHEQSVLDDLPQRMARE
ncbi:MAG TPA: GntR family transcriptional regulator [Allosphingosinicella sp.]|nr:GntR family transcriptional regulator [Allosphingosinicella sp.]